VNSLLAVYAGSLALIAAAVSVTRRDAVHALLYLLATLLALSAAFFALGANFAAVLQILIYAGAIVVVFVFVVMAVDASPAARSRGASGLARGWPGAASIAALVAAPFLLGLGAIAPGAAVPVSAQAVGRLLFGPWALAVELASFLLLAGLIGVRHLGRRDRQERRP
jgi:NADH-quinone oxidoreductase subunit J